MDDGDPARLTVPLVLRDAELQLRRRADRTVRDALRVGCELMAGYRASEVRERLGLSAAEYRDARGWLRDAINATRRD